MIRIPNKDKKFIVDNFSTSYSRGNLYSTWNIMFDADIGRIKLNPYITPVITNDTEGTTDLGNVDAMVTALKSGSSTEYDVYALSTKSVGDGGVFSTGTATRLTGSDAPDTPRPNASDMCLYRGANFSDYLYVCDLDGLHYIDPGSSAGDWTLIATNANWKNHYILEPFPFLNRLYMTNGNGIFSIDGDYTMATSGANTLTNIRDITSIKASSDKLWISTSPPNSQFYNTGGNARIYEWDGVSPNPTATHVLDTQIIFSMVILDDIPYAVDGKGRLWKYNGYTFVIVDQIPYREDTTNNVTIRIHRNGLLADKNKIYMLVGSASSLANPTERALSGIWCYDPNIGLYHYSSPMNTSLINRDNVGAMTTGGIENTFYCGLSYYPTTLSTIKNAIGATLKDDTTARIGHITTQFIESNNIDDIYNSIIVKYRKMFSSANSIEVKYRTSKGVECNTQATWTAATTFTVTTTSITNIPTPVSVGDEVQVLSGANAGQIANIVSITPSGSNSIIALDRSSTLTSGTARIQINNYRLIETITYDNVTQFKKIALGQNTTQLQVRLVIRGIGYYDEVQEIMIPEKANES